MPKGASCGQHGGHPPVVVFHSAYAPPGRIPPGLRLYRVSGSRAESIIALWNVNTEELLACEVVSMDASAIHAGARNRSRWPITLNSLRTVLLC